MPLRARLEPVTRDRVIPGDAAIDVRIVNDGSEPEIFHEHQARRGSLMLQVEDESGRRVLLPPPSPPDERDFGPPRQLAPGESVTLRYTGFLDARRETGRYRVRLFSRSDRPTGETHRRHHPHTRGRREQPGEPAVGGDRRR